MKVACALHFAKTAFFFVLCLRCHSSCPERIALCKRRFSYRFVIHFSEEPEEFDRTQTARVVIMPAGRPAKAVTADVAPGEWKVVSIKD